MCLMECPRFRLACRLGLGLVEAVRGFCLHQYCQYYQAASREYAAIPHVLVLKENRKVEEFDDLTTKSCHTSLRNECRFRSILERNSFRFLQSYKGYVPLG